MKLNRCLFALCLTATIMTLCTAKQYDDTAWRKYAFEYVYNNNVWKNDASVASGPGSTLETTKELRLLLPAIIKAIDAHTLLDAGCGDFNWLKETDLALQHYFGVDIVSHVIEKNKKTHTTNNRTFMYLDVTQEQLPKVDVILCRDCLAHLSFKDVKTTINNLKKSGATYLLATSYFNVENTNDIKSGNFHFVNLQATPFNLPEPLMTFDELSAEENMAQRRKRLCLWRLNDVHYFQDVLAQQPQEQTAAPIKATSPDKSALELVKKIAETITQKIKPS